MSFFGYGFGSGAGDGGQGPGERKYVPREAASTQASLSTAYAENLRLGQLKAKCLDNLDYMIGEWMKVRELRGVDAEDTQRPVADGLLKTFIHAFRVVKLKGEAKGIGIVKQVFKPDDESQMAAYTVRKVVGNIIYQKIEYAASSSITRAQLSTVNEVCMIFPDIAAEYALEYDPESPSPLMFNYFILILCGESGRSCDVH